MLRHRQENVSESESEGALRQSYNPSTVQLVLQGWDRGGGGAPKLRSSAAPQLCRVAQVAATALASGAPIVLVTAG